MAAADQELLLLVGRLTAQVSSLESRVSELTRSMTAFTSYMEQNKGSFRTISTIGSIMLIVGTVTGWVLDHAFKYLTK